MSSIINALLSGVGVLSNVRLRDSSYSGISIRKAGKEKMTNKNDAPKHSEVSASQDEQSVGQETVLIVDDVRLMRMSLKRVLSTAGYSVVEAEDGTRALEALNTKKIDLVIADIKMPDMDGLQLVQRIRSDDRTTHIPVLMCTASNLKQDILQAVQLGIQGFLLKPISPIAVTEKVHEVFHQKKRETPKEIEVVDI